MSETRPDNTVVQEIVINAPAERIFAALTDPTQRMQWWGAEGRFQTTHMESDLRIGGKWTMRGTGMGNKSFRVSGQYLTIERPHLLVFTWLPDWHENPRESVVRIELREDGSVTSVRLTHSDLTAEGARVHRGWPDILDWLRTYLEGKR